MEATAEPKTAMVAQEYLARVKFRAPLAALSLWRITDEDCVRKYALGHVRISCDPQGNCKATASDGRCIVQIEWKDGAEFTPGTVMVPREVCRTLALAFKKYAPNAMADIAHDSVEFDGMRIHFAKPDAAWPNTQEILDDSPLPQRGSALLSTTLLLPILQVAKYFGEAHGWHGVDLNLSGDSDHAVMLNMNQGGMKFRAAVMPMYPAETSDE